VTRRTPSVRLAYYAGLLVLALTLVPVALAGKGHSGGTTSTPATLTVTPGSVPSGGSFQASGCGYRTGQQANVVITSPSSRTFFPIGVDGNGCVAFGAWTSEAGQYTVAVYQSSNGGKQSLMASAPLTVY
jgi:hypothetical protein